MQESFVVIGIRTKGCAEESRRSLNNLIRKLGLAGSIELHGESRGGWFLRGHVYDADDAREAIMKRIDKG